MHAIEGVSVEQLQFRPTDSMRSVGEVASHIGFSRIEWFERMNAPSSKELAHQARTLQLSMSISSDRDAIRYWLDASWQMVDQTLSSWTTTDLFKSYLHTYHEKTYRVSYQWTIWRILAHDLHHGGELGILLGMQDLSVPELGDLGGHLTEPPLA